MSCIFCKIINKQIPSYKVYEDDLVYAFLDLSQLTYGHTLVVLKEHTVSLFDTEDDLLSALITRVKLVEKLLSEKLNTTSFQLLQNTGLTQEVKHLHFHIIPIYESSDSIVLTRKTNYKLEEVYHKLFS